MDSQVKPSYKSIVSDMPEFGSVPVNKGLVFTDYDLINFDTERWQTRRESMSKNARREAVYKKELLLDMLNEVAYVTNYVREYYGFKGIGDELKLEDVMNAFETSIKVDVHSDADMDFVVSEEEEL